jgi:hypothetical protein
METLKIIQRYIPLEVNEVPSGTAVFEWTVPREWNIRKAPLPAMTAGVLWILPTNNNLHIVQYSPPIDAVMPLAVKAIADSLRDGVNSAGVRVTSIFPRRTATESQRAIFAVEEQPYRPERPIQPTDVAGLVLCLLQLPRTNEIIMLCCIRCKRHNRHVIEPQTR